MKNYHIILPIASSRQFADKIGKAFTICVIDGFVNHLSDFLEGDIVLFLDLNIFNPLPERIDCRVVHAVFQSRGVFDRVREEGILAQRRQVDPGRKSSAELALLIKHGVHKRLFINKKDNDMSVFFRQ